MHKVALLVVLVFSIILSSPAYAFNPFHEACDKTLGNGNGSVSATCNQNSQQLKQTTNPVYKVIHDAANVIASAAGVVAVITIIYAGLRLVISGDNPEQVSNARGIIINTLVGLVIISVAWLIITVVLKLLQ